MISRTRGTYRRLLLAGLTLVVAVFPASAWAISFTGLGDLAGGSFLSYACRQEGSTSRSPELGAVLLSSTFLCLLGGGPLKLSGGGDRPDYGRLPLEVEGQSSK